MKPFQRRHTDAFHPHAPMSTHERMHTHTHTTPHHTTTYTLTLTQPHTHTPSSLQLPYKTVEVNPMTKAELKWSTYRKVPVIQMDGGARVAVDSSAIMSELAAELEAAGRGPAAGGAKHGGWWVDRLELVADSRLLAGCVRRASGRIRTWRAVSVAPSSGVPARPGLERWRAWCRPQVLPRRRRRRR